MGFSILVISSVGIMSLELSLLPNISGCSEITNGIYVLVAHRKVP